MSKTGDWALEQEELDRENGFCEYEYWYYNRSDEEIEHDEWMCHLIARESSAESYRAREI